METLSVFAASAVANVTRETKMEAIRKNLLVILNKMDVPEMRKELTAPNLRWLQRNLFIHNKDKDEFPAAVHLMATLLVMMGENPTVTINRS